MTVELAAVWFLCRGCVLGETTVPVFSPQLLFRAFSRDSSKVLGLSRRIWRALSRHSFSDGGSAATASHPCVKLTTQTFSAAPYSCFESGSVDYLLAAYCSTSAHPRRQRAAAKRRPLLRWGADEQHSAPCPAIALATADRRQPPRTRALNLPHRHSLLAAEFGI